MKIMNTPSNRAEFERNFHLLQRAAKDGKLRFASGLSRTLDGLARVRVLPNGRIDFLSVDESARCLANSSANFSEESFEKPAKDSQDSTDVSTGAKDDGPPPLASDGRSPRQENE
jgi:hypothetical protein